MRHNKLQMGDISRLFELKSTHYVPMFTIDALNEYLERKHDGQFNENTWLRRSFTWPLGIHEHYLRIYKGLEDRYAFLNGIAAKLYEGDTIVTERPVILERD